MAELNKRGTRGACTAPEGTKNFLSWKLNFLNVCLKKKKKSLFIHKIFLEQFLWGQPYACPGVIGAAGLIGLLELIIEWHVGRGEVMCL